MNTIRSQEPGVGSQEPGVGFAMFLTRRSTEEHQKCPLVELAALLQRYAAIQTRPLLSARKAQCPCDTEAQCPSTSSTGPYGPYPSLKWDYSFAFCTAGTMAWWFQCKLPCRFPNGSNNSAATSASFLFVLEAVRYKTSQIFGAWLKPQYGRFWPRW